MKEIKKKSVLVSIGVTFLILTSGVLAEQRHVPSEYPTIQAAIDDANDGDDIVCADGTYTGDGNRDIDFLGKAITVRSENGAENCIIDCNGTQAEHHRGFYFWNGEDANAVLEGFTITRGYTANLGGGIRCEGSSPTIANCTIKDNRGRGIYCSDGGATIIDCRIIHNGGRGIYCKYGGMTISGCTIGGNRGGGVVQKYSSLTISGCVIRENTSENGAGIYSIHGTLKVSNSVISGNSADDEGGGIYCSSNSNSTITNCVFSRNLAPRGGGIYCYYSRPVITNCTITENKNWGLYRAKGPIKNCILWDNMPSEMYECSVPIYSCYPDGDGNDLNINKAPLFSDAPAGDYHLMRGSPCIDAGNNNAVPAAVTTDLDQNPRYYDDPDTTDTGDGTPPIVDMGAYEYAQRPRIAVSPRTLRFQATLNGANANSQIIAVRNGGGGTLNWRISKQCTWLEVDPNAGSSTNEDNEVTVSVDIAGLGLGNHNCKLEIHDPNVVNSPQTIQVNLVLGEALYVPTQFPNIQAAIDASGDGDVVYVADGIYTGTGNKDLSFGGRSITVRSENGPENCIIDCEGSGRGFKFKNREDPNSIVEGFTITNGNQQGGAIYCYNSSPIIKNCIMHKNRSPRDGGGVFCDRKSNITITKCIITENYAGRYGGGLRFWYGSKANVNNCIIAKNNAHGIYTSKDSPPVLTNCTIVENTPSGLCNCYGPITNCVIWGNIPYEMRGSSEPTYSCYSSASGGRGNIKTNPLFTNAGGGDYRLSTFSTCINAGDPYYKAEHQGTDIDGDKRIINVRVDMGADEVDYTGPILEISSSNFLLNAFMGKADPTPQILSIRNKGTETLEWDITGLCPWVEVTPTTGESTGDINKVALGADISGLALGRHDCELTITAEGAIRSPQTVAVTLYVFDINAALYVPSEFVTIQAAINNAKNGDVVIVEPKMYTGPGNRDIDFLGKAITVKSMDPDNPDVVAATTINAQANLFKKHRGFKFSSGEDANSVLDGFTITNCYSRNGAAIYCHYSSPTVSNCVISGNDEEDVHCDGIIYLSHSAAIIRDCTISDNKAGKAAAFYLKKGNPTIEYCTIRNNRAYRNAGAIYCMGSSPTIRNSLILRNYAGSGGSGGGIYCTSNSKPVIINCTLMKNKCHNDGGGIYLNYSDAIINNCIITENIAGRDGGGGIHFHKSNSFVSNCTITGNVGYWGGGILGDGSTLVNCIIWGNSGNQGRHEVYGSPTVLYSNIKGGFSGLGNIDADPCFAGLAGSDYHLLPDSPCIDAGDPNYVGGPNETDLDSKPRVIGGRVDMGAYEFNHLPVACIVGGDKMVEAGSDCEARIVLDGSCSSDADSTAGTNDDINNFDWYEIIDACDANNDIFLGSGEVIECNLGLGEHLIILEVTDRAGAFDTNEVVITAEDVTPPEFSLSVEPNVLWPPNNKMVKITPWPVVGDHCDESVEVSLVDITMGAEGDVNDYVQIDGDGSIYLRASKGRGGAVRIYTLTYEAVDDSGNAAIDSATVVVRRYRR